MAEKCSLVFTIRSPAKYKIEESLALLWTVCMGGTLAFAPLKEYVTETCYPLASVTLPSLQSIPPLPYSESLNTNRTISSRTGNLLFFNHLLGLRSSIWILSIKIVYHSQYNSLFLSSRATKLEIISSLIPEPSKDL